MANVSTTTTSATGTTTKLRDSCNSCAVSKVRCNKGKPVCARCAKRGMRCEYFATKRAGRKHDSQSSAAAAARRDSAQAAAQDLGPPAKKPATASWDIGMPDSIPYPSPSTALSGEVAAMSSDDTAAWWLMNQSSPETNDWFASPLSFGLAETPKPDALRQNNFNLFGSVPKDALSSDKNGFDIGDLSTFLDADSPLIFNDSSSDGSDQSKASVSGHSSSLSSSLSSSTLSSLAAPRPSRETSESQGFSAGSSHCCLIRALELLKKLFPGSAGCTCQNGSGGEVPAHGRIPTIDSVVVENKHTLEAIHSILQCPCSSGSYYLLAIVSLVIFKVLGWYKAAVHEAPAMHGLGDGIAGDQTGNIAATGNTLYQDSRRLSCHAEQVLKTPTVVGGYRLDGDDQSRMAAQLVLSELHRVQRLINELASRLKPEDGSAPTCDIPFFSPTWFGQLETDLRNRVRALSLEIVDMLK